MKTKGLLSKVLINKELRLATMPNNARTTARQDWYWDHYAEKSGNYLRRREEKVKKGESEGANDESREG